MTHHGYPSFANSVDTEDSIVGAVSSSLARRGISSPETVVLYDRRRRNKDEKKKSAFVCCAVVDLKTACFIILRLFRLSPTAHLRRRTLPASGYRLQQGGSIQYEHPMY
jgi:hypothetical protein